MAEKERENSHIPSSTHNLLVDPDSEGRGWLQQLLDQLSPSQAQANSARAMESAHRMYAAYRRSPESDITLVDAAFKHYMEASRGIRRSDWALLYSCTFAALVTYRKDGKRLQDLERLVRMGNEAMASWTYYTKEPAGYGVRIAYVAGMANKDFYVRSTKTKRPNAVTLKDDDEAFKHALKCFAKVVENDRDGNLKHFASMELGILIVTLCRYKEVTVGLKSAIPHLESALKQVGQDEESQGTPATSLHGQDALRITYSLTLAHYSLYVGQVKNPIVNRGGRSGRMHNLNVALDYLEKTRTRLEQMKGTTTDSPKLQFQFGALLVLRWLETKTESDAEEAKMALEAARAMKGTNEEFKWRVDKLLLKVGTSKIVKAD